MRKPAVVSTREADQFETVRSRLAGRIARWTADVESFATPVPNLTLYRHNAPTEAMSCMVEPAIALTVQGAKRAILRDDVYAYDRHRFLLTTLDLPVVLQAVEASKDTPYLSLVLRLDERAIAELVMQSAVPPLARQLLRREGSPSGRHQPACSKHSTGWFSCWTSRKRSALLLHSSRRRSSFAS